VIRVITGEPGTGKTTYVAEHKQPADVVLDWDALAYAIGSEVDDHHDTDHEATHIRLATHLWVQAWNLLMGPNGKFVNAWIIHADPAEWQWKRYRERGVTIVAMHEQKGTE